MSPETATRSPAPGPSPAGAHLEERIASVGRELAGALLPMMAALPGAPQGPQRVAKALGVDKVLASRLLKALRQADPLAVVYRSPGPEPLRRVVRGARALGVDDALAERADEAVGAFETLVKLDLGDRSALDSVISAWLPEARAEFELRRKQAAFRAISELKGVSAATSLSTVLLHPASDGETLDVVWISGWIGLRRLRPGVTVRSASHRFVEADGEPRHPLTISGERVEGLAGLRLDAFCTARPAPLEVHQVGESVRYLLGDSGFGPDSAVDLLYAEVNRNELPRYLPAGSKRRPFYFTCTSNPARLKQFDVLLHEDVYPGTDPELAIYDTVIDGVVDANDPTVETNRLDLAERVESMGTGTSRFRTGDVPRYVELVRHVLGELGWDGERFRGYRCRVEYPVYGSQTTMRFRAPVRPEDG